MTEEEEINLLNKTSLKRIFSITKLVTVCRGTLLVRSLLPRAECTTLLRSLTDQVPRVLMSPLISRLFKRANYLTEGQKFNLISLFKALPVLTELPMSSK